jgi:hypothetical protein
MDDRAERMRVLWKSGRDKYRSFFAVLDEVRGEIGSAKLPAWCVSELHIGLSVIMKATALLTQLDQERIKTDNAAALAAEREQRAAKQAAEWMAREQAAMDRERIKVDHAHAMAKKKHETTLELIAAKKAKDQEKRRQERQKKKAKTDIKRLTKPTLSVVEG